MKKTHVSTNSQLDFITDWDAKARLARYRVTTLAKRCHVTTRHLRRYFQQLFGESPHSWMAEKRFQRTRQLLATGTLVKQAAVEAGFTRQENFSRQFKRYFKVAPVQLRLHRPLEE